MHVCTQVYVEAEKTLLGIVPQVLSSVLFETASLAAT